MELSDTPQDRYRTVCPGDNEPLESMTPAMREIVLLRQQARTHTERAVKAVKTYIATVIDSEFIRHKNAEMAKLVPQPMSQEDIDNYVDVLDKATRACYSQNILHNLLSYRMELFDVLQTCRAIRETFSNLVSLVRVSQRISTREFAVQCRLRHPWSFMNYVRDTPAVPCYQTLDSEPDWDRESLSADSHQHEDASAESDSSNPNRHQLLVNSEHLSDD